MHTHSITPSSNRPIGIFDSGMGGLTVLRALTQALPEESYLYIGDTARLPYGTKSASTIRQYAAHITAILMQHDIKLLVIACNTATTRALPHLKQLFPTLPIIGVVDPGAKAAARITKTNTIAILATESTINSGIYQNALHAYNPSISVLTQSCGLLVALAEEGILDEDIVQAILKRYLASIMKDTKNLDCMILGCTHFPIFTHSISTLLGNDIHIVDSAKETATAVCDMMASSTIHRSTHPSRIRFLVTDLPERFIRIGEIFFGRSILPETVTDVSQR